MLVNIEKKFNSLALKTKLQLFLLPLLLLYFLFYFYNSKKVEINISDFTVEKEKKFEESYLDLFEKIEKLAFMNKLEVISLKKEKTLVKMSLKGSLSKVSKFLFDVENLNNFTKVSRIKYEDLDNSKLYELDIRLDKFYSKNLAKIDFKQEEIEKEQNHKLNAIVGNFVVINEKMYKLGENIDSYELSQIEKNHVLLKNEETTIKLELQNEKFAKLFN